MAPHQNPSEALELIIGPLREVVQDQRQPLKEKLNQLAVLDVRFQLSYSNQIEIEWRKAFDTDTQLSESLLWKPCEEVINLITEDDRTRFLGLSPSCIMNHDACCREVGLRWDQLCRAVQESVLVDKRFVEKAVKCVKVHRLDLLSKSKLGNADCPKLLDTLRNFHSLTAFVQGLCVSGFESKVPRNTCNILRHERNYLNARKALEGRPGLPFLFPFGRECQMHGPGTLSEVYLAVVRYQIPLVPQPVVLDQKNPVPISKPESRPWPAWLSLLMPCLLDKKELDMDH